MDDYKTQRIELETLAKVIKSQIEKQSSFFEIKIA